jgi:hypothetical protein
MGGKGGGMTLQYDVYLRIFFLAAELKSSK